MDVETLTATPYTCISYSWGSGRKRNSLFPRESMSDRASAVLEAAVRAFPSDAVWLDAVCVPADEPARSECLSRMGAIYEAAERVLVVLSAGTAVALDRIDAHQKLDEDLLSSLEADDWVTRAWTYQELVNARKVAFVAEAGSAVVDAEGLLNHLGQALAALTRAGHSSHAAMQKRYPRLHNLETALLDWRISGSGERSAYQVLSSSTAREALKPAERLRAILGAVDASADVTSAASLGELTEQFMAMCERKGDFSFIFTMTPRSFTRGKAWRPKPSEGLQPVFAWPAHGPRQSGRIELRKLELDDVQRLQRRDLLPSASAFIDEWLEPTPAGSKDDRPLAVGLQLKSWGYSGSGRAIETERGYFLPEAELALDDDLVLVVATTVRFPWGAPGLILRRRNAILHDFVGVGVFVGEVPAHGETVAIAAHRPLVFISYRRGDGAKAAEWLRARLLQFRLPRSVQNELALESDHLEVDDVVVDRSIERAAADFYRENIKPMLLASRALIVVASPSTEEPALNSNTNWSLREVGDFLASPQADRIIVALTQRDVSVPRMIAERFPNVQQIALWPLRSARGVLAWWTVPELRVEVVKIIGSLLDVPAATMPELYGEAKAIRVRRLRGLLLAFLGLAAAGGVVAWFVLRTQRGAAEDARRAKEAQQQRDVQALRARDESRMSKLVSASSATERIRILRQVEAPEKATDWMKQSLRELVSPATVATLGGHADGVPAVAFAPGQLELATGDKKGDVRLWSLKPIQARLLGHHSSAVNDLVFDPRGDVVASAAADGIRLWSIRNSTSGRLNQHRSEVLDLAIDGKGSTILSGASDGSAIVWHKSSASDERSVTDPASWSHRVYQFAADGFVNSVDIDASGSWAIAALDKQAYLWPPGDGRQVPVSRLQALRFQSEVNAVALSKDGRYAAAGDESGALTLRETQSGKEWRTSGSARVTAISFSHDGRHLALANGKEGRVFSVPELNALSIGLENENRIYSLAFSPNDTVVAAGTQAYTTLLWPALADGIVFPEVMNGHRARVWNLAFSPGGQLLATASDADEVVRISSVKRSLVQAIAVTEKPSHVAVDSAGRTIVVAFPSGVIAVWKAPYDTPGLPLVGTTGDPLSALGLDPQGNFVAAISRDAVLRVWALAAPSSSAYEEKDAAFACFASNGLLVVRRDGAVLRWNVDRKLQRVGTWPALRPTETSRPVAFCGPDGRAVVEWNGETLYQSEDPEERMPLQSIPRWPISEVAWEPHGTSFLIVFADGSLGRWRDHRPEGEWILPSSPDKDQREDDARARGAAIAPGGSSFAYFTTIANDLHSVVHVVTRAGRETPVRADYSVTDLAFTSDGHWLIATDYDRNAIVIDPQNPATAFTLPAHSGGVEGVLTHDAGGFVTWATDRTLLVWPALATRNIMDALHRATDINAFVPP